MLIAFFPTAGSIVTGPIFEDPPVWPEPEPLTPRAVEERQSQVTGDADSVPLQWISTSPNSEKRSLKTRESSHSHDFEADADTHEPPGQETAVENVDLGGSKLGIPEAWIASPDNVGKRSNDACKLVPTIHYNKQALTMVVAVSFEDCQRAG